MTPSLFSIVGIYTYGKRKLSDQKPFLDLNYSQERRLRKQNKPIKEDASSAGSASRRRPAIAGQTGSGIAGIGLGNPRVIPVAVTIGQQAFHTREVHQISEVQPVHQAVQTDSGVIPGFELPLFHHRSQRA